MSIEKNKEQIKERLIKGVALTDEDVRKVSSGSPEAKPVGGDCPNCGYGGEYIMWYDPERPDLEPDIFCGMCGYRPN